MHTTVIIVPGLSAPAWPKPFSYLLDFYNWFFELKGANDCSGFKNYLESNGTKVIVSDYYTGISSRSISEAGKKLAKIIDSLPESRVILFAYSLGAAVAEEGIRQALHKEKVAKLICVASPHRKQNIDIPDSINITNIYSDADSYLNFANRMLYFRGYKNIGNATNIILPNLKHYEFNKNSLVTTASGKMNLFEYYFKLITE